MPGRNRVTRPRQAPVWQPDDELLAVFPDVSGNDINGVGETEVRRPEVIMWANPRSIAHGDVQVRMTEEFLAHDELSSMLRMDDRHERAPLAPEPVQHSPSEWTARVLAHATTDLDPPVDLVGIVRADEEWFFSGRERSHEWVVVLGIAMDHDQLATAPEHTSAVEVHRRYNQGTMSARALADWIRSEGYDAVGHGGPGAGPMLMVPAAIAAGFGELGKHGSIINRRLGSSFRLAIVLTDLPLVPTPADEFGAHDFCLGCRVCAEACPPAAISHEPGMVRGVEKFWVDFDACMPYFAASYGCGICIAVCPWSTPGAAPRLAENMERKRRR